jgi:hypothetical protein
MIKPDVPMTLFDPVPRTYGLSKVDLPRLAMDVIYAGCFQAKLILDRSKEPGELLRRKMYCFDMFG